MPIIHAPLSRPLPDNLPRRINGRRLLLWLIRHQWQNVAAGIVVNFAWMTTIAIVPILFGQITDTVIATGEGLWAWIGVFVALAVIVVFLTIAREYVNRYCTYTGVLRTIQLVNRHVTSVGSGITRKSTAGEVLAGSAVDPTAIGATFNWGPSAAGAFLITCGVSVVLFSYSAIIGFIVVIGLALHFFAISKLLTPLQKRVDAFRSQEGKLAHQMVDIVEGIRVLRAIGGEERFNHRFSGFSELLRKRGFKTAFPTALIEGLTVVLPAAIGIAVLWVSVLMALDGNISAGDVVTIFGLSTYLLMPLRNMGLFFTRLPATLAACHRVANTIQIEPAMAAQPEGSDMADGAWDDPLTGVSIEPGQLTVMVGDARRAADLADRLCGYTDSEASIASIPIRELSTEQLRHRVIGLRNDHILFSGSLRDNVDPHRIHSDDRLQHYLDVAAVRDAYDSLGGFDGNVVKDGRNISGGQRQRVRLARVLAAEPDYLFALEPTSALDAYTESLVIDRVVDERRGRTTVVTTTSPLWLESADRVIFLPIEGGAVSGEHHQLRRDISEYATTIARELT